MNAKNPTPSPAAVTEHTTTHRQCDVLVIGGGIHGVGVAQAAAAAGYATVLLEQSALAAGTSSKSSKLIHGGLRYLEQAEVGLVRESVRERELLLRLAPDLVRRHTFNIPIYPQTTRRPWQLRIGLSLYSLLAGFRAGTRFSSVPRGDWNDLDGLRLDSLQAVLRYQDAQTDDALLTAAVMQSAQQLGAELLCPAEFVETRIQDDGCLSRLRYQDETHTCHSLVVVNAAGPWANRVLQRVTPRQPEFPVDLVQGTHIELPGHVRHGSYYVEAPQDRRAVFVMPWYDRTLVGTTEHVYEGDPAAVQPLEQEVDYLLAVYAHYFPDRERKILDAWAGLRVLPRGDGRAFARSRETQLPTNDPARPRLLSIFGGKLTGYRATAEKILNTLAPTLPARQPQASTETLRLPRPVAARGGPVRP